MGQRSNNNPNNMRGFFAIGSEGLSKAYNAGALYRTAHAFGASFLFNIGSNITQGQRKSVDKSNAVKHLPYFEFPDWDSFVRPAGTALVGVELVDESIDLPNFYHPPRAVYVLGPEDGSLAPETVAACDYVVKIPTKFCVNVGLAGAILMYDRVKSLSGYSPRNIENKPRQIDHYNDVWIDPEIVEKMKQYEEVPYEYLPNPKDHRE